MEQPATEVPKAAVADCEAAAAPPQEAVLLVEEPFGIHSLGASPDGDAAQTLLVLTDPNHDSLPSTPGRDVSHYVRVALATSASQGSILPHASRDDDDAGAFSSASVQLVLPTTRKLA